MNPSQERAFLDRPDRPWNSYRPSGALPAGAYQVRHGLADMAEFGVRQVRAGRCDGLRFDVFNAAEANFLHAYMAQTHPSVPFTITRVC